MRGRIHLIVLFLFLGGGGGGIVSSFFLLSFLGHVCVPLEGVEGGKGVGRY